MNLNYIDLKMAHFWHDLGKAFCLRAVIMVLGDKLRAASIAEVAFLYGGVSFGRSYCDIAVDPKSEDHQRRPYMFQYQEYVQAHILPLKSSVRNYEN
ncbi:hypothetical protein ABW03_19065 [Bacillus altitudinis]|nr:hypothetical protein ABW03_19065 [Bacillus altitudinis]